MRRRWILALAVLGALVIAAAAAVPALRAVQGAPEVPLGEVRRGSFVRTVVAEGLLEAETATVLSAPTDVRRPLKIAWLERDGSPVAEGDVVIRFDPTELESSLQDGTAERSTVENDMVRQETNSGVELQDLDRIADLAGLELDYAKEFQSKDPEIFSRTEIIESEIDEELANERKKHATEKREIRDDLSRVEMDLLGIRKKRAELKIEEADHGLRSLEVRAPHDGIFVLTRDWQGVRQVGEVVWSGRQIAELPRLDSMEAKVYVLEADAGGIEAGCEGRVVLEAHPDRALAAKVKKIAALAMSRGWRSPVQYFEVVLELEKTDPAWMKPGQRVRAELFLDREAEALYVPRDAVFEKDDGVRVVHRRTVLGFEEVEVELGAAAPGRVVVRSGLEEGDTVALQDPGKRSEDKGGANGKSSSPNGPGVVR